MKLGSAVIDYIAVGYEVELWEFGNVHEIYDHLVRNGIIPSYISREKVAGWDAAARKIVNAKANGEVAVTPPIMATGWERSARALPERQELVMNAKVRELYTRINTITQIAVAIKALPSAPDKARIRPELLRAAMMLIDQAVGDEALSDALGEPATVIR